MRNKFFLLLLLLVPAFIALTHSGYFPMHDDIQPMRLLEMKKCILDTQIPCRWVPDMGFGYGYPQFNYYGPLPYYLMAIPVLLGAGILSTVKLGFALSIIFSGLSMYAFGSYLWGKKGGIISALFYTYAPYRAVDVYVRGAMGEAWAYIFLPLMFLFALKILDGKKKAILPLALSVAGLALTHNVTVLMVTPFFALYILLARKFNIKHFKNLVFAGIWGVCLSAFFVLPAFFEKNYVHVETILEGYFNYAAHFVGIKQLLLSSFWGYGTSQLGDLDGLSLSVGLLIWTIPLFVLAMLLLLKKKNDAKEIMLYLGFALIALFLIHPKSRFLWDHIQILSYIQFPWRFLALAVFFLSTAAGAFIILLPKYKYHFIIGGFTVLFLFYGNFFKPSKYIDIGDEQKFSGSNWMQQQTISIFDYLPIYAATPPGERAPERPTGENIEIVDGQKGTDWQKWEIVAKNKTKVTLPIFDFPNWVVKVDGNVAEISHENSLGLIEISMPHGTHSIDAKLTDTPLRSFSNIISLVAILLIPIYVKNYRKTEE